MLQYKGPLIYVSFWYLWSYCAWFPAASYSEASQFLRYLEIICHVEIMLSVPTDRLTHTYSTLGYINFSFSFTQVLYQASLAHLFYALLLSKHSGRTCYKNDRSPLTYAQSYLVCGFSQWTGTVSELEVLFLLTSFSVWWLRYTVFTSLPF